MRRLAACLLIALVLPLPAMAQARDRSLERISLALQQPSTAMAGGSLLDVPPPPRLGPFTFVEPQMRGEMVRLSLPIGAYVMNAVRGVAQANQRRKEAAARRQVAAALKQFAGERRPQQ